MCEDLTPRHYIEGHGLIIVLLILGRLPSRVPTVYFGLYTVFGVVVTGVFDTDTAVFSLLVCYGSDFPLRL